MHPISDEIEAELAQVAREIEHLALALKRIDRGHPLLAGSQESWETSLLCASAAEKIYTGCERVMAKFATEVDGERVDKQDGWHKALIDRMSLPFHGRDAILTPSTYALLQRLRSFRQRERNSYGFDLDTAIVLERAREAIRAFEGLAADIRRFLADQSDGA